MWSYLLGRSFVEKRKQTKVSFVCIVSRLCFQALGNTPDTGLVYKLIRSKLRHFEDVPQIPMLDWVWLVWACIKTSLVGSLAFVISSLLLGTPTHWDAVLWHVVPFALQQVSQSFPPPWPPYAGVAFREVYSFSVPPYCFFTQRNLRSSCQCGSFFLFLMVFLWAAKPLHPVTPAREWSIR